MSNKELIFILGSGRSGSSVLTRVLSLCGCALPQALLGANSGNPTGYWEPIDAALMNLKFSRKHIVSLDTRPLPPAGAKVDERERSEFIAQIQAFLSACPLEPLLVVKEPSINVLANFWFEAARREGFSVKAIIPFRHPQEYIASATHFAPLSPGEANDTWLYFNLIAELWSRDLPRVFIAYRSLVEDWRTEISRIRRVLSVDLHPNESAIDSLVTSNLYRERYSGPVVDPVGHSWNSCVYSVFSAAANDGEINLAALSRTYDEYRADMTVLRGPASSQNETASTWVDEFFEGIPIWKAGREF